MEKSTKIIDNKTERHVTVCIRPSDADADSDQERYNFIVREYDGQVDGINVDGTFFYLDKIRALNAYLQSRGVSLLPRDHTPMRDRVRAVGTDILFDGQTIGCIEGHNDAVLDFSEENAQNCEFSRAFLNELHENKDLIVDCLIREYKLVVTVEE